MEIKNLKKAADRIKKAIRNKERIVLYGDNDLDGAGSVIILKESIMTLGGKVTTVFFPDREKEGYGVNEKALKKLKKFAPALFIALDCGISNFKEIKLANKLGFEVIIIDHHQVLDELPQASIVVDPKQKGDRYPFKDLSTAGIAYRLSLLLLKDKMSDSLRRNFLELAALATIADMMPETGENREIIQEGISSLEKSFRPGIQALFEMDLDKDIFELRQKVSKIISFLNIRDIENDLPVVYRVLATSSLKEARQIANNLLEKNITKKERIQEIKAEIEDRMEKDCPIVFAGDPKWELVLLGIVASIICHQEKKPTFLFKKMKEESQGSVRSLAGTDSVGLMKKCKKHLLTFGGHAQASGFRVKNKNLDKFKECLVKQLN